MKNSRPVYSTETGRIRSDREEPASPSARRKGKGPSKAQSPPADGVVRIQRETKGRKGKTATLVTGIPLDGPDLKAFAKRLKRRCGTGGSVKDGVIVIQGDHRETLLEEIREAGYPAKLAGG